MGQKTTNPPKLTPLYDLCRGHNLVSGGPAMAGLDHYDGLHCGFPMLVAIPRCKNLMERYKAMLDDAKAVNDAPDIKMTHAKETNAISEAESQPSDQLRGNGLGDQISLLDALGKLNFRYCWGYLSRFGRTYGLWKL
ncbi:taspase, threonine aspartase, 1 [Datura stramonium]|uniref:Taspase, threonine aspartase, 1 n=1 Tax=Datura stramonium TaxID=4076 RepID=A0ABS8WJA9_DATST|nr:taspase, threonine aspartase, 1 [Datura stramonium]